MESLADLLKRLKEESVSEHRAELAQSLPSLLHYLQQDHSDEKIYVDIMEIFQQLTVPSLSCDDMDRLFFKNALPKLDSLLSKIVKTYSAANERSEVDARELSFQVMITVIDILEMCLHKISSAGTMSLQRWQHFIEPAVSIVSTSLRHCKESESIYGSFLNQISDSLTSFYNKTQSVLKDFLSFVLELQPDTGCEVDVGMLTSICDGLFRIIKVTKSFNINMTTSIWKSYMRIVTEHHAALKDRLDVSIVINFLCSEIQDSLSFITKLPEDERICYPAIKLSTFNLKIVVTICDFYKDYLGDCIKPLVSLLIFLYRSCPPAPEADNLPSKLHEDLTRSLSVGIEPLMIHLIEDINFIEVALNLVDESEQNFALCLMYSNLLIKMASLTDEIRVKWLTRYHKYSLMDAFFRSFDKCDYELQLPVLMPGIMCKGKPQRLVSFYEYTCSIFCGFVASLPARYFENLEQTLFEWLLHDRHWSSLFVSDVLCFLGRYGSAELCFEHCTLLCDFFIKYDLAPIVANLIPRMVRFLADDHKKKLPDLYPLEKFPKLWTVLPLRDLPSDVSGRCRNVIVSHYGEMVNSWTPQMSIQMFKNMILALRILKNTLYCDRNTRLVDTNGFSQIHLGILQRLPSILIKLSYAPENNTYVELVVAILDLVSVILPLLSSDLLHLIVKFLKLTLLDDRTADVIVLSALDVLKAFGHVKVPESEQRSRTLDILAECFAVGLGNDNYLSRTYASEAFATFARLTSHVSVIQTCVKFEPSLQTCISDFVNKVPVNSREMPIDIKRYVKERLEAKPGSTISSKKRKFTELDPPYDDDGMKSAANEIRINLRKIDDIRRGADPTTLNSLKINLLSLKEQIDEIVSNI